MTYITAVSANALRAYTRLEMTVDGIIHAVGILGGLVAGIVLIALAVTQGSAAEVTVATVYICGLMAMFGCSMAYNHWHSERWRDLLRGLDHSAIFLMIAGSYTPFTVLLLEGRLATAMTALVWSVAVVGMGLRLWRPRWFARSRLALYLALGWIGIVAIGPLTGALGWTGVILLGLGGVLYSLGVVFHVWSALPFQNAIWHAFVLAGASVHYAAICKGVLISSAARMKLAMLGLA